MSVFALGDIHGCRGALKALIDFVPIRDEDLVITLGDYVDRGPDSKQVVQWVMDRTALGTCIPLRGNHEIMMLEVLRGTLRQSTWLRLGGDAALDSYAPAGRSGTAADVPESHRQFLEEKLLSGYETPTHLFVHASLDWNLPLSEQSDESLYWNRFNTIRPHQSGKTVICGHTPQRSGRPADRGFAICIDTWAYGGGWLTCLNVETGQYWQANQAGITRTDYLNGSTTTSENKGDHAQDPGT